MTKATKIRVCGVANDSKYKKWIEKSLQEDTPKLDYFSFAKEFNETQMYTNAHYTDILAMLTKNQSNKLTNIANEAKKLFKKRDKECDFGDRYRAYWQQQQQSLPTNLQQQQSPAISGQQQRTLENLNLIACQTLENQARQVLEMSSRNFSPEFNTNSPSADSEDILHVSKDLCSSVVGQIGIIDLTSDTVQDILPSDQLESLLNALSPQGISQSQHAQNLINALENASPSIRSQREALYETGFRKDFNTIDHWDAGFIETTVRHFLDLMESPRNPLNQPLSERSAAVYTTIYILNQLFLTENDIIEFGWIERECSNTSKRKWDGVAFLVNNKNISAVLVEFSGGNRNKTAATKEKNDILKLYTNLLNILEGFPENVEKLAFCVRFYDDTIYFERLLQLNETYYRQEYTSFAVPTTPRLLIQFVNKLPKIFKWKKDVVKQTTMLTN